MDRKPVIGSPISPDLYGRTRELTMTFTWEAVGGPPPEVRALHDAFMLGEPVTIGIGDARIAYRPIEASQSIAGSPQTMTVRLMRKDEP